jgi:hypothetical protein
MVRDSKTACSRPVPTHLLCVTCLSLATRAVFPPIQAIGFFVRLANVIQTHSLLAATEQ